MFCHIYYFNLCFQTVQEFMKWWAEDLSVLSVCVTGCCRGPSETPHLLKNDPLRCVRLWQGLAAHHATHSSISVVLFDPGGFILPRRNECSFSSLVVAFLSLLPLPFSLNPDSCIKLDRHACGSDRAVKRLVIGWLPKLSVVGSQVLWAGCKYCMVFLNRYY